MARLVDNYQSDERILMEIASHGLLTNIQQLVRIQLIFLLRSNGVCVLLYNFVSCLLSVIF